MDRTIDISFDESFVQGPHAQLYQEKITKDLGLELCDSGNGKWRVRAPWIWPHVCHIDVKSVTIAENPPCAVLRTGSKVRQFGVECWIGRLESFCFLLENDGSIRRKAFSPKEFEEARRNIHWRSSVQCSVLHDGLPTPTAQSASYYYMDVPSEGHEFPFGSFLNDEDGRDVSLGIPPSHPSLHWSYLSNHSNLVEVRTYYLSEFGIDDLKVLLGLLGLSKSSLLIHSDMGRVWINTSNAAASWSTVTHLSIHQVLKGVLEVSASSYHRVSTSVVKLEITSGFSFTQNRSSDAESRQQFLFFPFAEYHGSVCINQVRYRSSESRFVNDASTGAIRVPSSVIHKSMVEPTGTPICRRSGTQKSLSAQLSEPVTAADTSPGATGTSASSNTENSPDEKGGQEDEESPSNDKVHLPTDYDEGVGESMVDKESTRYETNFVGNSVASSTSDIPTAGDPTLDADDACYEVPPTKKRRHIGKGTRFRNNTFFKDFLPSRCTPPADETIRFSKMVETLEEGGSCVRCRICGSGIHMTAYQREQFNCALEMGVYLDSEFERNDEMRHALTRAFEKHAAMHGHIVDWMFVKPSQFVELRMEVGKKDKCGWIRGQFIQVLADLAIYKGSRSARPLAIESKGVLFATGMLMGAARSEVSQIASDYVEQFALHQAECVNELEVSCSAAPKKKKNRKKNKKMDDYPILCNEILLEIDARFAVIREGILQNKLDLPDGTEGKPEGVTDRDLEYALLDFLVSGSPRKSLINPVAILPSVKTDEPEANLATMPPAVDLPQSPYKVKFPPDGAL